MSTPPPAKDYLGWVQMIVSVAIVALGVGVIVWLMMNYPDTISERSELFIGWFLGILTGAAIYLGIMRPKTNQT